MEDDSENSFSKTTTEDLPEDGGKSPTLFLLLLVLIGAYFLYKKMFGPGAGQARHQIRNAASSPSQQEPSVPVDHEAVRQKRLRRIAANEATASTNPVDLTSTNSDLRASAQSIPRSTETAVTSQQSVEPVKTAEKPQSNLPNRRQSSPTVPLKNSDEVIPAKQAPSPATPEQLFHAALLRIFAINLDGAASDATTFLPVTATEVLERESKVLAVWQVDSILLERIALFQTPSQSINYLVDCTTRLFKEQQLKRISPEVAADITRSVASQMALLLLEPSSTNLLLPLFTSASTNTDPSVMAVDLVVISILEAIANQFGPDELQEMLKTLFSALVDQLTMQGISGQFSSAARALVKLLSSPVLAQIMIAHRKWNPTSSVPIVNPIGAVTSPIKDSILGSLFSLSGYGNIKLAMTAFTFESDQISVVQLKDAFTTARGSQELVRHMTNHACSALVKSPETRSAFLQWIATHIIQANYTSRTGLASQLQRGRSPMMHEVDGLFLNVAEAMVGLCKPFTDTVKTPSVLLEKLKLVDPDIFFTDILGVDLSDDTMLSNKVESSGEDTASIKDVASKKEFGFVSRLFFTAHLSLHSGFITTTNSFHNFVSQTHHVRSRVREMEASSRGDPMDQQRLMMMRKEYLTLMGLNFTMESVLDDPALLQPIVDFYTFTCHWLKGLHRDAPRLLARVPEFIVEDIAKLLLYLTHAKIRRANMHDDATRIVVDPEIITVLIVLMGENRVKNPHLRATIADVLLWLCRPDLASHGAVQSSGLMTAWDDPLKRNPEAIIKLIPTLLQLYCDIERTGAPGEFYQKFNVRYQISLLLKHLRSLPEFQKSFRDACNSSQLFISFMNFILNDSIYLLDEVIAKLPKIREVEQAMQDLGAWNAQDAQTRQEREQEHRQNENIVSTYSRLGNETLLLLHYLTANDISSLLEPEMLARLAQLLNYFLMSLAGPKRKELSVNANDKLHFSPRTLLASLCEIYVSLDRQCGDQFLNALVNDPRAFKIDIFTSCVQIVTSKSILKEPSLGQFIAVVKKLEAKATEQKGEEDIAAEAPDEFLDPLLATLMTDPVTLPSGMVMDRGVIVRHLLSNATDPFTRKPMKLEDVVPNTELKLKIETWLAEKRNSRST